MREALRALLDVVNEGADELARVVHPDRINAAVDAAVTALETNADEVEELKLLLAVERDLSGRVGMAPHE